MKKKQTLLAGTPRQIVAGLFLSIVLALLVLGGVLNFVSPNSVTPDGTRVTLASPFGDRDGPRPEGTRVTLALPSGNGDTDRDFSRN